MLSIWRLCLLLQLLPVVIGVFSQQEKVNDDVLFVLHHQQAKAFSALADKAPHLLIQSTQSLLQYVTDSVAHDDQLVVVEEGIEGAAQQSPLLSTQHRNFYVSSDEGIEEILPDTSEIFDDYNHREVYKQEENSSDDIEQIDQLVKQYSIDRWDYPQWKVIDYSSETDGGSGIRISSSIATQPAIQLLVKNVEDNYPASSSYCLVNSNLTSPAGPEYNENSAHCNLRSAWLACLSLNETIFSSYGPCKIILPAFTAVYMNRTYGQLEAFQVPTGFDIQLIGNQATIQSVGKFVITSPKRINGLPYKSPTLSKTNSARINTVSLSLQLCGGSYINITTTKITGDPYLRLVDAQGVELTVADDQIGLAANIHYQIPSRYQGCNNQFKVVLGCFMNTTCSMTLVGNYSTGLQPRFLFYQEALGDTSLSTPSQLMLSNVTLRGFGFVSMNGGCVYADGALSLMVRDVVFANSVGGYGGGIFINNNPSPVYLQNVQFLNMRAVDGCGVFVDKNNTNVVIFNVLSNSSNLISYGSFSSKVSGVGVSSYFGNNVTINKLSVRYGNNMAIGIGNANKQVSVDQLSIYRAGGVYVSWYFLDFILKLKNVIAIQCRTTCISFNGNQSLSETVQADISNMTFLQSPSSRSVYVGYTNMVMKDILCVNVSQCIYGMNSINVTNLVVKDSCSEALYVSISTPYTVMLDNIQLSSVNTKATCNTRNILVMDSYSAVMDKANAKLTNILIQDCKVGAAMSNIALHFINTTIQNCSRPSSTGGGLYILGSRVVLFYNVTLYNNSAPDGGGGLMMASTNNVTFVGCNISYNTASKAGGGGIYFKQNSSKVLFIDSYSYNTAGYISYQYTSIIANQNAFNQVYSVPGVTAYLIKFNTVNIGNNEAISVYVDNVAVITYNGALESFLVVGGYCEGDESFAALCLPGIHLPTKIVYGSTITVILTSYSTSTYTSTKGFDLSIIPLYSPDVLTQQKSIFTSIEQNYAAIGGGGINAMTSLTSVSMVNTIVSSNKAFNYGGGMVIQFSNKFFTIVGSNFTNNTAGSYGGGIYFQMGNSFISIVNGSIANNTAKVNGGGIGILSFNGAVTGSISAINITNNVFDNNTAQESGGALFFGDSNLVIFNKNIVQNNRALTDSGGAWYIDQANQINATQNQYINNYAYICGGAVNVENQNLVILTSNIFQGNAAYQFGGGICSNANAQLTFNKTQYFLRNQATFGGGIAVLNNYMWRLAKGSRLIIDGNVASRGSAVFIRGLLTSGVASNPMVNITFQNNRATTGGTVFWVYDSAMIEEPAGMRSASIQWINNTAEYGTQWATQGIVFEVPAVYVAAVYGDVWNTPLITTLWDAYDQQVMLSNDSFVYPTLLSGQALTTSAFKTEVKPPQCGGFNPYLSGSNIVGVSFQKGHAVFDTLGGYCTPGGNFTIQFEAKLGDHLGFLASKFENYDLLNKTLVTFRECIIGEYEKNGQCLECPSGQFSLTTPVTACQDCSKTTGVDECYSDQIVVMEGYWRRHPGNTAVMECPMGTASCIGGNMTGEALCGEGYGGPLCAVCEDGYYLSDNACQSCEGKSSIPPATIAILVAVPLVGLVLLIAMYYKLSHNVAVPQAISSAPTIATQTVFDQLYTWWKTRYADMMVRTKIIVSTYQIVTATATVFDVTMPAGFANFANTFNFLNFGLTSIVPLGCVSDFNFMATLLWTTMLPVLLITALACMFVMEMMWLRRQLIKVRGGDADSDLSTIPIPSVFELMTSEANNKVPEVIAIKQKYLNYLFYITYLILPSTTTTIFKTFICKNVDPYNEDEDTYDYYLAADMSISCQSDYYYNWVVYAVVMIFVYPIGIPAMYFCMLYANREEIRSRDEPVIVPVATTIPDNEELAKKDSTASASPPSESASDKNTTPATPPVVVKKRTLSPSVTAITFLFGSYGCRYWYWELVETYRRIFLTAVVSVIQPGTPQQNVISILFAIFFIRLYGAYQPYGKERSNILAEMGQVQIFFTFFMALLIQSDVLSDNWMAIGDVVLVWLNIGVMIVILYFQYQVYVEKLQVKPSQRVQMIWDALVAVVKSVRDKFESIRTQRANKASLDASFDRNPLHSDGDEEIEIEMGSIYSNQK